MPERADPPSILLRLEARPGGPSPADGPALTPALVRAGLGPEILAVEEPFAILADDRDALAGSLGRTRRLTLRPGADAEAAVARLRALPSVEAAWVERRYRVSWADASAFLAPGSAPAGDGPGRLPRPAGGTAIAGSRPAGEGPAAFTPDDPLFVDGSQWGLRNDGTGPFGGVAGVDIRAGAGWDVTTGSSSTIVAIVDTGLDLEHPELAGRLADGSPRIVRAYNSSIEAPGASASDSVGHGTMVAGVALARTNNGPQLDGRGVAGVAGGAGGDSAGCRVIAIKATPTRMLDALSSELAEGIVYAVTHGARVINLSFGGDEDDDTMLDAISYASRRGCVVVCGAGNGQDARPQYPGYYARYGAGLSIAALSPDGSLARFSSRGPQIDVAAPGEHIVSSYLTYANAYDSPLRNFAETSGTSFAAPFVAGLAGLAMGLQPSMTDNEFQHLLRHTARDAGAPGRDDTYGWGVPDAGALLAFAAPPRGFVRGTARAQEWTLLGSDSVTLAKTRLVVNGCGVDGRYRAERWEVRTRVSLPAGLLLDAPLALARTHATRGWTAGPLLEYDLGFGEVVAGSATADGFTLRTHVYRIEANPVQCATNVGPIGWVPARPESVYFGWSAFGRLDAPPRVVLVHAPGDSVWSVDEAETLRWEASDPDEVSGFTVDLSLDGGATWRPLGSGVLPGTRRELAFRSPCGPGDADYRLRLTALDLHGRTDQAAVEHRFHPARACAGDETPEGPPPFALYPVVPNPARGSAALRFSRAGDFASLDGAIGAGSGSVATGGRGRRIDLFDARGRRVRSLPVPETATGTITWDGRDGAGRRMPAGLYLGRFRVEGAGTFTQRFVLLPP